MKVRTEEPATGHVETSLPFDTELDAGGFEQFCTDLLNLHPVILCQREGRVVERRILVASRLQSGASQYGADIRADVSEGEAWGLQCKRVKSFSPSQVAKAIAELEQGFPHADQYVLITTCGLTADAQRQIDDHPKWIWWDTSRLTTITQNLLPAERGMNLVKQHFGMDWVKRLFVWGDQPLLSWQEFFAPDLSSKRQHFHHRTPFFPWSDAFDRLKEFALQGAGRAMILTAPGGKGKSRLLLELARQLERTRGAPRVRFLNLNRSGLNEEQADFLSRENVQGNLLLIVDDAHRLDTALGDIASAASNTDSIRLLVATRPQAFEAAKSQLFRQGYAERLDEPLRLPQWKRNDMIALAEQVLDRSWRSHAPRLAGLADQCPLLVIMGGALINAGQLPEALTDEDDFRERVFKGFSDEFLRLQPEPDRKRRGRLIQLLSFISPALDTDLLLKRAADILDCRPLDIAEDLQALSAAGLTVENREGIRLYPDLYADAVLLDVCLDHKGQTSFLHRTVLEKLPIDEFPSLMRNVAQADWEARSKRGAKHSLFDPIWTEFARRFEEGKWPRQGQTLTERLLDRKQLKDFGQDRTAMLDQWTAFAVYLPERTLELAELAIKLAEEPSFSDNDRSDARATVNTALPSMLEPVVLWHPEYAHRALDLLWSLDFEETKGVMAPGSGAITVIAKAAGFDAYRPLASTLVVVTWLEARLQEPAAVERLRRLPWILSALLKPIFQREVEHNWRTGRTVHLSSLAVNVVLTRPLRQRALAIVNQYLNSSDPVLSNAIIPVLEEAISPPRPRFRTDTTKEQQVAWRTERLEALKSVEHAIGVHSRSPPFLLQCRRILLARSRHDPDPVMKRECSRVLSQIPDTFEMRVARVLTSSVHDEFEVATGPSFESEWAAAEQRWAGFIHEVAREATARYPTATEFCRFVRQLLDELSHTNLPLSADSLLGQAATISSSWCASLMIELLHANKEEASLDASLYQVIFQSSTRAPQAYLDALDFLPVNGRPEQLVALVSFLGWKQVHGGGLSHRERDVLLEAAMRSEDTVVSTLARVCGVHFSNEPKWAVQVLIRLKPAGERASGEVLRALVHLVETSPGAMESQMVARCLANLGEHCLADVPGSRHFLQTLARHFPVVVYEHLRNLIDAAADGLSTSLMMSGLRGNLGLGPIEDSSYISRELDEQWTKVLAEAANAEPRLALTRSLLWSDSQSAPQRLLKLIRQSNCDAELELVANLAAPQGTRFVFQFPDITRALLERGVELGNLSAIQEALWKSACGGPRGFTNGKVDPEYHYILEQGELLSTRYRVDTLLGPFFRLVAESERRHLQWSKAEDSDDDLN